MLAGLPFYRPPFAAGRRGWSASPHLLRKPAPRSWEWEVNCREYHGMPRRVEHAGCKRGWRGPSLRQMTFVGSVVLFVQPTCLDLPQQHTRHQLHRANKLAHCKLLPTQHPKARLNKMRVVWASRILLQNGRSGLDQYEPNTGCA